MPVSSLPATMAAGSSMAVPAVQRLLSIRAAYMNETGVLSVSADFASAPPSSSSLSLASQLPSATAALSAASLLPHSLCSLAFSSSDLECAYQSDYSSRYFAPLRRVVLACVTIWCLFVINDVVQQWENNRKHPHLTIALRFAVAAAVAAITLSSYHPAVKQHIGPRVLRWTLAAYIVLFGTCQVAFGVIEENTLEPTYCDFIILLAAMSASLFRLPFSLSTACNVLLFIVFVILTVCREVADWELFYAAMVWLAVALLLFSFNAYLMESSMRSTFFAAQQLAAEEANSQRVLATMLPVRVIAELRHAKSAFVYEHHRSVSVLFSHIHQFDQHTATLEATAVVELLNDLFSRFDLLTDMFGVYKVETIGDVYLVSCGVPDALEPHASVCCLLALAMMEETSRLLASRRLQLRIGVHSGDVIAGVVGMKYPRYRLMGDTVNTASRMSTTCDANQIQISRATFSLLSPDFICEYYGLRTVKGKGPMQTYVLKDVTLPANIAAQRRSWSRAAEDDDKEPLYHSTPIPATLYSNVTLPPHVTNITADDTEAIFRDRDAGKTVHRVRHCPTEHGWEEKRDQPQQQPAAQSEDDQKDGGSAGVSSTRSQRFVGRTSISRLPSELDRLSPPHSMSFNASRAAPPVIRIPSPPQSQSLSPSSQSSSPLAASVLAISPQFSQSQSTSPSQQSISAFTPSTPSSSWSPGSLSADPASCELSVDRVLSSPSPPSTTYTLSAARVRDTFLSHSGSQSAAFLQHFQWSRGEASPSALSTSSLSLSLLLTCVAHPVSALYDLLRTIALAFRPAFEGDSLLSSDFQLHWVRRTLSVSRLGFTVFVMGSLILGLVELMFEKRRWDTWIPRSIAVALGLGVLLFSYCYKTAFCQRQQAIVAVSWTVMTILTIGVSMIRADNTELYGVSVTIILVTTSSFFVGLQFRWVSFTTLPILLVYFIGAVRIPGGHALNVFFLLAAVCLSMMSAHAAEHFAQVDFIRHRTLNEEEAKTRYILDNMLPKSVMDQLVRQHSTGHHSIIAHQCERAAVLFCDIVQFTALAAVIRPEDVVAILNVLFSAFDALTTLHSVYKVETIGDAYLACSGVVHSAAGHPPSESSNHSHVESLVLCALDFIAASQHCRTSDNRPLQLRIGIHTGTVVAGVIGRKMPRYHLFGESGHNNNQYMHAAQRAEGSHSCRHAAR